MFTLRGTGCARAALLAALLSIAARAEDAPKPDDTKKTEAPAAEAKTPAKTESAPPGAEAKTEDPAVLVGKPPEFPLKSTRFEGIVDAYEEQDDAMSVESGSLEDILVALRACSHEHLLANATEQVTFKELMKEPDKFRGHLVRQSGVLRNIEKMKIPANKSGLTSVWRGQVSQGSQIVSFLSIEPTPQDVKVGTGVRLVGVFMKRYAYLNRQEGEKLTWSPLIIVRRLEQFSEAPSPSDNPVSDTVAGIIFVVVGLSVGAYLYVRVRYKTISANYFTRVKQARNEPQPTGNFPRHGAPGRNFPKPGDKKPG